MYTYIMTRAGTVASPFATAPQSALTEPFWTALEQQVLAIQRCDGCATWRWTPQLCCPRCLSERCTWTPASGHGELYSYTVVRRSADAARFPVPYVLAIVRLDEGPHLLTTLVDCDEAEITIGQPVEVAFRRTPDGVMVYPFVPCAAPGDAPSSRDRIRDHRQAEEVS